MLFSLFKISESSSSLGYCQLHQRCINQGLKVTHKNALLMMKELNPDGVVRRQATTGVEEVLF